jgi:hypothetical protein
LFDQFQHGATSLPSSSWQNIVFPNIAEMKISLGMDTPGDLTTQNTTIQLGGLRPQLDYEIIADQYLGID